MKKIDLFAVALKQLRPDSWWTEPCNYNGRIEQLRKMIKGKKLTPCLIKSLHKKQYTNHQIEVASGRKLGVTNVKSAK